MFSGDGSKLLDFANAQGLEDSVHQRRWRHRWLISFPDNQD